MKQVIVAIAFSTACSPSGPAGPSPVQEREDAAERSPAPRGGAATADGGLVMAGVRLLEPEAVMDERLPDPAALADLLTGVAAVVARYDQAHPGAISTPIDAVVVVRSAGVRVWLVGPTGDVDAPGLEAELAHLPRVRIVDRHVAVIVSLARDGGPPARAEPRLPAAWLAAAGPEGADIDTVIDRVWPR